MVNFKIKFRFLFTLLVGISLIIISSNVAYAKSAYATLTLDYFEGVKSNLYNTDIDNYNYYMKHHAYVQPFELSKEKIKEREKYLEEVCYDECRFASDYTSSSHSKLVSSNNKYTAYVITACTVAPSKEHYITELYVYDYTGKRVTRYTSSGNSLSTTSSTFRLEAVLDDGYTVISTYRDYYRGVNHCDLVYGNKSESVGLTAQEDTFSLPMSYNTKILEVTYYLGGLLYQTETGFTLKHSERDLNFTVPYYVSSNIDRYCNGLAFFPLGDHIYGVVRVRDYNTESRTMYIFADIDVLGKSNSKEDLNKIKQVFDSVINETSTIANNNNLITMTKNFRDFKYTDNDILLYIKNSNIVDFTDLFKTKYNNVDLLHPSKPILTTNNDISSPDELIQYMNDVKTKCKNNANYILTFGNAFTHSYQNPYHYLKSLTTRAVTAFIIFCYKSR